jgi:DNA-binding NarL/FixJ family response regulator
MPRSIFLESRSDYNGEARRKRSDAEVSMGPGVDPAAKRPRVLLADDHVLILSGIRAALEPRFEIVGQVTDGKALLGAAETLKPDVIVLDISMPGLNGFEAARQLRENIPSARLVFLSQHLSPAYLKQALAIDVSGYVLKSETIEELEPALHATLKGDLFTSPRFGAEVLSRLRNRDGGLNREMADLTDRQREILQLLVEGRSNKEIAAILNVSIKTVEFHRAKIMSKLGAQTAAELSRVAIRLGIIPE